MAAARYPHAQVDGRELGQVEKTEVEVIHRVGVLGVGVLEDAPRLGLAEVDRIAALLICLLAHELGVHLPRALV